MLTTLLDGLTLLGRATLHTVWLPVLAWTILALPIWWGLERADGVHPFVTYRLHQTLLAALPLGLLVAALGLPWTGGTGPLLELPTLVVGRPSLSVEALDAGRSGAASVSWHWMQGVGLATTAAGLFAALDVRLGVLLLSYPLVLVGVYGSGVDIDRAYWWYPALNTVVGALLTMGALWVMLYG